MNTETDEQVEKIFLTLDAIVEKQSQLELEFSQRQQQLEQRIDELEGQLNAAQSLDGLADPQTPLEDKLDLSNSLLADLLVDDPESLEAADAMLHAETEEENVEADATETPEPEIPVAKAKEVEVACSDEEVQRLRKELNEKLRQAEIELAIRRANVSQREAELEERMMQIDRRESELTKHAGAPAIKYDNSKESVLARLKQYLKSNADENADVIEYPKSDEEATSEEETADGE